MTELKVNEQYAENQKKLALEMSRFIAEEAEIIGNEEREFCDRFKAQLIIREAFKGIHSAVQECERLQNKTPEPEVGDRVDSQVEYFKKMHERYRRIHDKHNEDRERDKGAIKKPTTEKEKE